jgi:hypothetical protein
MKDLIVFAAIGSLTATMVGTLSTSQLLLFAASIGVLAGVILSRIKKLEGKEKRKE